MSEKRFAGGPKVRVAGFCFPEIGSVRVAVAEVNGSDESKKGGTAPVQALCGTFTPTDCINFSKLTRFNTRLRL